MKVNLGCGEDKRDEYVNIDIRREVNPDICIDIRCLTFPDESVDEVIAYDIIEHFPIKEAKHILGNIYEWLKPGGVLKIRVPDLKMIAERMVRSPEDETFITLIYGGQDYFSNFHQCGFTEPILEKTLREIGFIVLGFNYPNFNIEVGAVK